MNDSVASADRDGDPSAKRAGLVNSILRACDVVRVLAQLGPQVPLAQVRKLKALPADKKQPGLAFEVTRDDGQTHELQLVDSGKLGEPPMPGKLLGLVGRVSAGYKLFPAHTIAELGFEKPAPPAPAKGKDK